MNSNERAELAREAQEKLLEAIDLLRRAVNGHPTERNTKAYIIDHLRIMASSDHSFLSRDKNLDEVIEELMDRGYDDEGGGDEA